MRSWKSAPVRVKAAIAAAVVGALVLIGVVAVRAVSSPEPVDAPNDGSSAKAPLALGEVATISSRYRVAVRRATFYRGDDPFLAVTIRARYVGTGTGNPSDDLDVEYFGASTLDSFGETYCPVEIGDDADETTLSAGEMTNRVVCVDVPRNPRGGTVAVSEVYPAGARTYWSAQSAQWRAFPAPDTATTPPPTPTPTPAPAPRRTVDNSELEEQCDELNEDVEDFKDSGEDFQKEWRKNKSGASEDQRDDYDEWRDSYEEQLDRFEDLQKRC